jgi:hypothetical protein
MKRLLPVVLACCYSSYSYSETVYGTTGNAASSGYNWVMQNVLPQQAGLTVGNVIYRYTTVKDPASAFTVAVQNSDADGDGYIFRSVDDWTGLPGNTINKVISVGNIPIQRWGDGSIEGTGEGIVTNPYIAYTYKYDPCFDPQVDPSCPGYQITVESFTYDIYNPLEDPLIQAELEAELYRESEEEKQRQRKKMEQKQKQKERLEVALGAVDSALLTSTNVTMAAELIALNPNIDFYYKDIPGGAYEDVVKLADRQLPDNPKSKRAQLAQEVLHQEMIQSQYKSSTGGLE